MKKTRLFVLVLISCITCMFIFSACAPEYKYGEAETYYNLNTGNTFYFDGNGYCDYAGIDCTYYIEDSTYYINNDDTTLTFKKVNDGVLAETFKNTPIYLNISTSVSNGRISGDITYGSSRIYFYIDGTYHEFSDYTLVGSGNYYFNEGVLVQEQTLGMTSDGSWSSNIVYYGYYVDEETGKLSGVLLADPDHYKQWHSDNNDNGEDEVPVYTPHTLTYDLNYDGAPTTTQQVIKGENVNLIIPERRGYEFLGWYYNGNKITDGVWQYDGDITLTARWEIMYYSITYNTDGGTMPNSYMETFTIESNLPYTLPVPIKQGYNFAGWYETADFSGQPITEIPKNSLRNYTLYAKYSDEELLEFELSFDETYYCVIGYKGSPQYITIPKTKDGLLVKEIAIEAFRNCDTLISIILPDSVTSIGNSAFYDCDSLTSITIPDSVTNIGEQAFRGCSSLTSIAIPDSVTNISEQAFYYCDSLTSITIPDSVTTIGNSAFYWCSNLTSVIIPDSVTTIGNIAFYYCSNLTSVVIPDNVTSIGDSAFSYCIGLTSITIGNSVTSIGNSAFYNCGSLASVVIPDSVTTIGDSAFSYCIGLTSIAIPDSVTTIGNSAFYNCSSLASVVIPDSVTSIGEQAFYYCDSLTSITIPDSVTNIGEQAFYDCGNLSSIFYKGSAENWNDITFGNNVLSRGKIYYFTETEPIDDGNYWHYDTDGKTPVIW